MTMHACTHTHTHTHTCRKHTVYGETFKLENFRGTKYTTHWKTFTVHQAVAIMYCTQQVIQGKNFRDRLKYCKNRESFAVYGTIQLYMSMI